MEMKNVAKVAGIIVCTIIGSYSTGKLMDSILKKAKKNGHVEVVEDETESEKTDEE